MASDPSAFTEGTVCWVEIQGEDVEACKKFYEAIFPSWQFRADDKQAKEDHGPMYHTKPNSVPNLSGGITKPRETMKSSAQGKRFGVVYYLVDSIEKTQEKIHQHGGSTLMEKVPESDSGYYAVMSDIEGNPFGIYEMKK